MIVPGSANPLLLGDAGYNIQRSLRFRSSASAYLSRTPASASNRKTWTWSGWVKRGAISAQAFLFGAYTAATDAGATYLYFGSGDTLVLQGGATAWRVTSQLFRDPSSWYHIVVAFDTTQATASNRIKIYVNGSQVTAFGTSNDPTLNLDSGVNAAITHTIAKNPAAAGYADEYLTEINFIDGQALTPSSFGYTEPLTGVWQPLKYMGTYGTNGFYLPFSDNTSATTLAYDKSGNGNNWTPNNISTTAGATYDSMTDVPTLTSATAANYCVLNPLFTNQTGISSSNTGTVTITNANLTAAPTTGAIAGTVGTIGVSSGKWYFETTIGTASPSGDFYGFITGFTGAQSTWVGYRTTGNIYYNNATAASGYATATTGDVIGVALDIGGSTVSCYKNGTLLATLSLNTAVTDYCYPLIWFRNDPANASVNFGQRPFSYTPPTGFVALNTYNLPTPTILAGNKYMDATTYTGNGSTQTITNSGSMQPDLVWAKSRSAVASHNLVDSVRGTTKYLYSNLTDAEGTWTDKLTSFNSNGFSLSSDTTGTGYINGNGVTMVAWQWQAGKGTTSSNTSGDITSTVSVNPTAGFSVVTWTSDGTASVKTVGHGLGVTPKFFICKNRSGTSYWFTYHQNLTSNNYYLHLESTDAQYNTGAVFFSQSSTTIGVRQSSLATNGQTCVAYCWAEIAGFSKFGSYTGNGSTDGPFVYCGFRPRYIMIKKTDAASPNGWEIWDTARDTYNQAYKRLWANLSDAENTTTPEADILSNGFKVRTVSNDVNTSGGTYIYAAFAENPFKYSLAR